MRSSTGPADPAGKQEKGQKRPKKIVLDLEDVSKKDLVNQVVKSPCHSEGESVDDNIDDSSSQADRRSHFTNTSVVKLTKHHQGNSINDTGEETSSMASIHSSSQGGFGYVLGADGQSRRGPGSKFGGKLAARKRLLKGEGQRSQQPSS